MEEPRWIRLDVVLAIHDAQLAEHGGLEGVRDSNALESAIASPRNHFAYGDPPDIAALAAQYAFSIACNQVFVDGNKRTAAVVCETFLIINGHQLAASENESYAVYMRLANNEITAEEFAIWIREKTG